MRSCSASYSARVGPLVNVSVVKVIWFMVIQSFNSSAPAALCGRALYAVILFVPTVLLPQTASRAAQGQRTRWLFAQALGAVAVISLAACALYALAPRFVITTVAGRAFAEGAPFVLPYVVAIAALATANMVATYNVARSRLRFVVPLLCVAAGEVVTVVLRHRSAADLLQTIVAGHALALLACMSSLGSARAAARRTGA